MTCSNPDLPDRSSPEPAEMFGAVVAGPVAKAAAYSELQLRVMRVAARLFAQRGFHAVSIRDIAGECNVSVSTVLYGGRSKLQLLEQILAKAFSGECPWPMVLANFKPELLTNRSAFYHAYDELMGILVRHGIEYPDTRQLWQRLLLDHPDLFESFEEKFTYPLFRHAFDMLRAAREQGLIDADDSQIQHFISGIDWILNGYFGSGVLDYNGKRVDPTLPASTTRLLEFLKRYGRSWFEGAGEDE